MKSTSFEIMKFFSLLPTLHWCRAVTLARLPCVRQIVLPELPPHHRLECVEDGVALIRCGQHTRTGSMFWHKKRHYPAAFLAVPSCLTHILPPNSNVWDERVRLGSFAHFTQNPAQIMVLVIDVVIETLLRR